MKAPRSFIVRPKDTKYVSSKDIGGVKLDVAAGIEDARGVSKNGIIVSTPLIYDGPIKEGDEVIIHHNVFRAYLNSQGKMVYTRAYIYDDLFHVIPEEVFLYKRDEQWVPHLDFCFVTPIREQDRMLQRSEERMGYIHLSSQHPQGQKVRFTPDSEYEIWLDDEVVYRMRDKDICAYAGVIE